MCIQTHEKLNSAHKYLLSTDSAHCMLPDSLCTMKEKSKIWGCFFFSFTSYFVRGKKVMVHPDLGSLVFPAGLWDKLIGPRSVDSLQLDLRWRQVEIRKLRDETLGSSGIQSWARPVEEALGFQHFAGGCVSMEQFQDCWCTDTRMPVSHRAGGAVMIAGLCSSLEVEGVTLSMAGFQTQPQQSGTCHWLVKKQQWTTRVQGALQSRAFLLFLKHEKTAVPGVWFSALCFEMPASWVCAEEGGRLRLERGCLGRLLVPLYLTQEIQGQGQMFFSILVVRSSFFINPYTFSKRNVWNSERISHGLQRPTVAKLKL
jgi:hypothetical protein